MYCTSTRLVANGSCSHAILGAEERPQWKEEIIQAMEQVLQLPGGDDPALNRRSFRGLGQLPGAQGKMEDVKPYYHQLYDLMWRRIKCASIGGAINADEPGFGKVHLFLTPFDVIESIDRVHFHVTRFETG